MVAFVLTLYLVAAIAHLYHFLTRRPSLNFIGLGSLVVGFSLHTLMLGVYFLYRHDLGWGVLLSSMAWAILFLYLLLFLRYREMALGGFAVPAAFVLEGYGAAFPGVWGAGSMELQSLMLQGHAALAVLSAGAFFLLFVVSLMYIVQANQLKSKRPGQWLHRLPSLDLLDELHHKILYFGFALLTASLLLGSMWAKSTHGEYWLMDPRRAILDPTKTLPLVVIWMGYGVLLVCRLTRSWKGKRSAVFSIFSFVAVLFALFVHL